MFLMLCKWREERARKEKKRSREEEEVVGVFVCPRRPLSSHYQGIRQMLPLYRCWFDSEPPTLIPSSLLAPTTPRQRLLSSSLHSALTTTTSSPNFLDSTFQLFPPVCQSWIYSSSHGLKKHKHYQNYLVHSQCKFVCSLISLTCNVCLCVRVCECARTDQYWKPKVPFWFVCEVFAWSLGAQLWPTGFWTHQLLSLVILRLWAGGRALVSGCCSLVPGHTGGSFKRILETLSSWSEREIEHNLFYL